MALVQGVHQTSWRSQTSATPPGQAPLIELSNALNKLNYDAESFINNPDFISFLTKELSSRHVYHDSKPVEEGAVCKAKDHSFLNNQSYFDYARLQELLLSWNCYCTINIYPKLNSQEIQHNLVFDSCLGEKQIPDNVASFIKNLLDRGTDLEYIINLLMAIQSGKNVNLLNYQQKDTQKKIYQIDHNINQQINNRKQVRFSPTLFEESNFESEKPILPPKKSTFKNPFKPFLQIKYRPFSKSPFRPSTRTQIRPPSRPPPPPAPTCNTAENTTTSISSETSTLSPCPYCPTDDDKVTVETKASDQSNENYVIENNKTTQSGNVDDINFIDGEDLAENQSPVSSHAQYLESIQEVMKCNNLNSNEKIYTVTKIQPVIIKPIIVKESLNISECLDSNNNPEMIMQNNLINKSEIAETNEDTKIVTVEDVIAPIAKMEPIYDLDLIDNFDGLLATETEKSVKKVMPPVPPPRKHRRSLILSLSTPSPELPAYKSPLYSRPHSLSLPARPIPPPRKRRSKHAHTLPKSKNSHQEMLIQDPDVTLPKTSKLYSSHCPISETQPLLETVCTIPISIKPTPIPPPRRRRPTAPNDSFKPQTNDSSKKKSIKQQFTNTTENIRNKFRSAMSQIYNTCKNIF